MAACVGGSVVEVGLEETLFAGVVRGPVEEYQGPLGEIRDIDARMMRGRTLLHVAVRGGRVQWVEALLEKGADPGLGDGDGRTVAQVASELRAKYPGDGEREAILKMVRLVHRWDAARRGGPGGGTGCTCRQIRGTRDRANHARTASRATVEAAPMRSVDPPPSPEAPSFRDRTEMASQLSAMREAIDGVKRGMTSRDILLESLESSVTSLAGEWRTLMEQQNAGGQSLKAAIGLSKTPHSEIPRGLREIDEQGERDDCVAAMMAKTEIVDASEENMSKVREIYSRLHSGSPMTACVLRFLRLRPGVSIRVDCSSWSIGGMRATARDCDGVERSGSSYGWFADLEEKTAYVGWSGWSVECFCGRLALALAQLSVSLAFGNGGRPYGGGDGGGGFRRVVQEAEEERRRSGDRFDPYLKFALDKRCQSAKEIYLIATVPWIIARHGSTEGRRILFDQVPSLLTFYIDHVMPVLLSE